MNQFIIPGTTKYISFELKNKLNMSLLVSRTNLENLENFQNQSRK